MLDFRGTWGREDSGIVQAMVGDLSKEKRAEAINSLQRAIAAALQTGISHHIYTAGKPPTLTAEVSYVSALQAAGVRTDSDEDLCILGGCPSSGPIAGLLSGNAGASRSVVALVLDRMAASSEMTMLFFACCFIVVLVV